MKQLVLAAAVLVLAAGCSTDHEHAGVVSTDCDSQIRVGDEVFSSYAFTRQEGTRHGFAEVAECHDLGEDADGSVFTDHPTQVRTWTFDGYSPEEVLGVRTGDDAFAVFIADSVPPDKRDRIGEELSLSTSDGR